MGVKTQLEHVHFNVNDLEAAKRFVEIALPEFSVRGEGAEPAYGKWVHLGTDDSYVALTERPGTTLPESIRHIGIVTSELDRLITRLDAAGYKPTDRSELDSHPFRRRVYYLDQNGLSWEFVEYLSDVDGERNDYS